MALSESVSGEIIKNLQKQITNATASALPQFRMIQGMIVYRLSSGSRPYSMMFSETCLNPSGEDSDNLPRFDVFDCLEIQIAIIRTLKVYLREYAPNDKCVYINANILIEVAEDLAFTVRINDCFTIANDEILDTHDTSSPECGFSKSSEIQSQGKKWFFADDKDFKSAVDHYKRQIAAACREDLRMTITEDTDLVQETRKFKRDSPIEDNMTGHKRIRSEFRCNLCNLNFFSQEDFEKHVHKHINELSRHVPSMFLICEADKERNPITKCGICNEITDKGKHVTKAHGDLLGDRLILNKSKVKLDCPLCRNPYPQYYDLLRHMRSSHLVFDKFRCHICKRQYVNPAGMHKHLIQEHYTAYLDFIKDPKNKCLPELPAQIEKQ